MDLSMYNLLSFCLIGVHPERRTGTRELCVPTHILVSLILHANARVYVVVESIRTSCLKMLSPGCILPSEHGKRVALYASSRGTWNSCTDHGWHQGTPENSILFVQQTHGSSEWEEGEPLYHKEESSSSRRNSISNPIELQEGDPSSSLDW